MQDDLYTCEKCHATNNMYLCDAKGCTNGLCFLCAPITFPTRTARSWKVGRYYCTVHGDCTGKKPSQVNDDERRVKKSCLQRDRETRALVQRDHETGALVKELNGWNPATSYVGGGVQCPSLAYGISLIFAFGLPTSCQDNGKEISVAMTLMPPLHCETAVKASISIPCLSKLFEDQRMPLRQTPFNSSSWLITMADALYAHVQSHYPFLPSSIPAMEYHFSKLFILHCIRLASRKLHDLLSVKTQESDDVIIKAADLHLQLKLNLATNKGVTYPNICSGFEVFKFIRTLKESRDRRLGIIAKIPPFLFCPDGNLPEPTDQGLRRAACHLMLNPADMSAPLDILFGVKTTDPNPSYAAHFCELAWRIQTIIRCLDSDAMRCWFCDEPPTLRAMTDLCDILLLNACCALQQACKERCFWNKFEEIYSNAVIQLCEGNPHAFLYDSDDPSLLRESLNTWICLGQRDIAVTEVDFPPPVVFFDKSPLRPPSPNPVLNLVGNTLWTRRLQKVCVPGMPCHGSCDWHLIRSIECSDFNKEGDDGASLLVWLARLFYCSYSQSDIKFVKQCRESGRRSASTPEDMSLPCAFGIIRFSTNAAAFCLNLSLIFTEEQILSIVDHGMLLETFLDLRFELLYLTSVMLSWLCECNDRESRCLHMTAHVALDLDKTPQRYIDGLKNSCVLPPVATDEFYLEGCYDTPLKLTKAALEVVRMEKGLRYIPAPRSALPTGDNYLRHNGRFADNWLFGRTDGSIRHEEGNAPRWAAYKIEPVDSAVSFAPKAQDLVVLLGRAIQISDPSPPSDNQVHCDQVRTLRTHEAPSPIQADPAMRPTSFGSLWRSNGKQTREPAVFIVPWLHIHIISLFPLMTVKGTGEQSKTSWQVAAANDVMDISPEYVLLFSMDTYHSQMTCSFAHAQTLVDCKMNTFAYVVVRFDATCDLQFVSKHDRSVYMLDPDQDPVIRIDIPVGKRLHDALTLQVATYLNSRWLVHGDMYSSSRACSIPSLTPMNVLRCTFIIRSSPPVPLLDISDKLRQFGEVPFGVDTEHIWRSPDLRAVIGQILHDRTKFESDLACGNAGNFGVTSGPCTEFMLTLDVVGLIRTRDAMEVAGVENTAKMAQCTAGLLGSLADIERHAPIESEPNARSLEKFKTAWQTMSVEDFKCWVMQASSGQILVEYKQIKDSLPPKEWPTKVTMPLRVEFTSHGDCRAICTDQFESWAVECLQLVVAALLKPRAVVVRPMTGGGMPKLLIPKVTIDRVTEPFLSSSFFVPGVYAVPRFWESLGLKRVQELAQEYWAAEIDSLSGVRHRERLSIVIRPLFLQRDLLVNTNCLAELVKRRPVVAHAHVCSQARGSLSWSDLRKIDLACYYVLMDESTYHAAHLSNVRFLSARMVLIRQAASMPLNHSLWDIDPIHRATGKGTPFSAPPQVHASHLGWELCGDFWYTRCPFVQCPPDLLPESIYNLSEFQRAVLAKCIEQEELCPKLGKYTRGVAMPQFPRLPLFPLRAPPPAWIPLEVSTRNIVGACIPLDTHSRDVLGNGVKFLHVNCLCAEDLDSFYLKAWLYLSR